MEDINMEDINMEEMEFLDIFEDQKIDIEDFIIFEKELEKKEFNNIYLNQKEIKEEIVHLNDNLKNYFHEKYLKENKNIDFDVDYSGIFLKNFKNKKLKKQIYDKTINNYKEEIEMEKIFFGNNNIKENYTKKEFENKKKLLIKELKKAKNNLKKNQTHKMLVSQIKSVKEEEIFYLVEQKIKKNNDNFYYDKKKTIIKFFDYIENKFNFKIEYNKYDLYNDSFEIKINSNKKIKINFEIKKDIGQASGYYSDQEKKITIITPEVYKRENMLDLEELYIFSHEFGHAVENLFQIFITAIDESERSEVISMYFENLISEEFIYELTQDKSDIEFIEYKNFFNEYSLAYTALKMLKSKNQENIKIKDKELKIYQGYLKNSILSYSLFHLKHYYVPFDQYFLGNYYSKIMKKHFKF